MKIEIIPLGTASAIPTRDRHLSATVLAREGSLLLFDCGEGTQMQLLRGGLKATRIEAVLISHFHGDHFFGLMGLISTLALLGRDEALAVVGPAGIAEMLSALPGVTEDGLPFDLEFTELEEGFEQAVVLDTPAYRVEARPLEHRVFTAGFRFEEKARPGKLDVERAAALGVTDYRHYRQLKEGRPVTLEDGRRVAPEEVVGPARPGHSFAYVSDTRPCAGGRALARGVDLLYHEATFTDDKHEQALKTAHSTAREAAEVARDAGAGRLLIGHFSARYPDPAPLVEEACRVFQNTEAAEELKRYVISSAREAA